MSDPWAEFTPAPPRQSASQNDPWAEFTPVQSSGGVRTVPAEGDRPARVIMDMGGGRTAAASPQAGQPGVIEDSVRGFGGGLIRGAAGTLGLATDTIPGFIADKADLLESKIRGETPDEARRRIAERRASVSEMSPTLAAVMRAIGDNLSTKGIQRNIESVTGEAYVPQTRPGKFASTAGEFVPGAMIGGLTNMARNAVAFDGR